MKAGSKDIKKLAQTFLRDQGFYSGEIDGIWGKLSNLAFERYTLHLDKLGLGIGGEQPLVEDGVDDTVTGIVVLDPGHGGQRKFGGSSANNATSASGVLEKTMTLDLAKRIAKQLKAIEREMSGATLKVFLTRSDDTNMSLSERAQVAEQREADIFLSIHYNGFNGAARGTETWILSTANGNVNEAQDRALAQRIQSAMYMSIERFDPLARDRGIKNSRRLGVLNDISLGNVRGMQRTRACLIEVEFIDNPAVDELLNTGDEAAAVNDAIARSIAQAIVEDLRAQAPTGRTPTQPT